MQKPFQPPEPYWTIGVVPPDHMGVWKNLYVGPRSYPELSAKGHWSMLNRAMRFASFEQAQAHIDARSERWERDGVAPFVFFNAQPERNLFYKAVATADDPTPAPPPDLPF